MIQGLIEDTNNFLRASEGLMAPFYLLTSEGIL